MKISLCTISFRHHLVSLAELAIWAQTNQFQGIELWAAHGRNLASQQHLNGNWLAAFGLEVPMVSDYLPTSGSVKQMEDKTQALCQLAHRWHARKLRTFAGSAGSAETHPDEREKVVGMLRRQCEIAADNGLELLVETHPGTLADCGSSTVKLLAEIDHPAFKINFDTLHVWEGGDDPQTLLEQIRPYVAHYHFKNVSQRHLLPVFTPSNVYAAAGSREGMVPLFDGLVDYKAFFDSLADDDNVEGSLEWFGNDVFSTLQNDRRKLSYLLLGRHKSPDMLRAV